MTEHAPAGKRGRYGAWQSFTVALGLLGGAGTAAVLATVLSEDALTSWGWRIPFLLALPLGLVALWVRLKVEETPVFREVSQGQGGSPADDVRPAETTTGMAIVLGIARLMGWAAAGYTFLVVMPSYLQVALGASFRESLVAGVVANLGFAASILPAGALSDRVGRKPLMLAGALSIAVLALPMLNLLQDNDTSTGLRFAGRLRRGRYRRTHGRPRTRDALGDVSHQGALHRPGPELLALQRGLRRQRRAHHHRADQEHGQQGHPGLLRHRDLRPERPRTGQPAPRRPQAPPATLMRVIGLMAGTSLDGIDAAAIDVVQRDNALEVTPVATGTTPYPAELRDLLGRALPPQEVTAQDWCELDTRVGQAFAAAALEFATPLRPSAQLVVSHGQTVFHWVEAGRVRGTLQAGQPAWIAEGSPGCPSSQTSARATSRPVARVHPW